MLAKFTTEVIQRVVPKILLLILLRKHTSVLVGNDLGLVINSVGDRTVGVAKGDTNRNSITRLRALSASVVTHRVGRRQRSLVGV